MAAGKRMTKAQIMSELADKSGLTKKEVTGVFAALQDLVKKELGRRGPGEFVIPDMIKLKVRKIPAKPARMGRPRANCSTSRRTCSRCSGDRKLAPMRSRSRSSSSVASTASAC